MKMKNQGHKIYNKLYLVYEKWTKKIMGNLIFIKLNRMNVIDFRTEI